MITSTQGLIGRQRSPIIDPVTPAAGDRRAHEQPAVQWIAARSDGSRQVVVLMSRHATARTGANGRHANRPACDSAAGAIGVAGRGRRRARTAGDLPAAGRARRHAGGRGAGASLFTRVVLRPLDRVADTADAIAAGDLQRRLQLPAGRNEVARLGKAFDYMVGRLVAALEAQRRFVADASHELRTPLTSLKGLAEILMIGAHGNDTRVIEQSAQAINGELDRLIRLVTDLLTLSRLNSTGSGAAQAARRTRMDVCTTMSAAVTQMARQAEMRGVTLRQECAEPLWMVGDAGQIKQVLLNLLDNALRYTPIGRRGDPDSLRGRALGEDQGAGYRLGHRRARPAAYLRALLQRRCLPHARNGQQRAGPGDCEGNRRGAWRQH